MAPSRGLLNFSENENLCVLRELLTHGEFNVRLDGEQGEANAGGRVLDVRARDRRPKLPPPVAQSGRAGAGVEREAEARPVAKAADAALGAAAAGYAQTLEWHHKRRRENRPKIDPRGLGTQLFSAASPNQVIKINAYCASQYRNVVV
jgi:hypothetical protein